MVLRLQANQRSPFLRWKPQAIVARGDRTLTQQRTVTPEHAHQRIGLTERRCAWRTGSLATRAVAVRLRRLKQIFPTGVCDYGRPGIGQGPMDTIWRRY